MDKRSVATIHQFQNSNKDSSNQDLESVELNEDDNTGEGHKESGNEKEAIFIWPDKAVMLFLELYHEREHEFAGLKRHNKIWSEIASELQKSNYDISGVQVQNKMSSLKRTYKKIKDSNAKSGNHNSSWTFYSTMDSLFGEKAWVSPPALASSEGPAAPNVLTSSSSFSTCYSSSSMDNFDSQEFSPAKSKKRRVESILDSYISDMRNDRDQTREERKREQLERETKREQRWEMKRAERKEMHKETFEIQRSLVHLLSKLVEK